MLVSILLYIVVWITGYMFCLILHKGYKNVGKILLVDEGEGSETVLLEVYAGCKDDIVPGNIVQLGIKKENIRKDN